MPRSNDRQSALLLLVLAAIGLYVGWKSFWFLTDDAYIAFRYVSNSILGHGYTWNPEPFRPVEGYTSFLWVAVLDLIWRVTGIQPPQSANTVALGFSFLSLVTSVWMALRLKLNHHLESHRLVLVLLLLVGVLVNTTFLTWTSSGLETALFNLCFLLWIVAVIFADKRGHRWRLKVTLAAALVYLARPDGILVVGGTGLLMLVSLASAYRARRLNLRAIASVLPLLVPVLHILWRRAYYGEWLPNTYYAKNVAAWPEAGIRYLASFVLEYGIWIWLLVLVVLAFSRFRWYRKSRRYSSDNLADRVRKQVIGHGDSPDRWFCSVVVTLTVLAHVGYYTFHIGGDHFEWRVYSHLVPLIFLSLFYMLSKLDWSVGRSATVAAVMILFSLPIPWTQHAATRDIRYLETAETLKIPTSNKLPAVLRWLTGPDDALQNWLLDRLICVKRMEHKLFWQSQTTNFPERNEGVPAMAGKYPVAYFSTVGVPGWVLPNVAIIDGYGLNDYVIARNAAPPREHRMMAHDRIPPKGYVESFFPNAGLMGYRDIRYRSRPTQFELSPDRIRFIEKSWEDSIVDGADLPDSLIPPH